MHKGEEMQLQREIGLTWQRRDDNYSSRGDTFEHGENHWVKNSQDMSDKQHRWALLKETVPMAWERWEGYYSQSQQVESRKWQFRLLRQFWEWWLTMSWRVVLGPFIWYVLVCQIHYGEVYESWKAHKGVRINEACDAERHRYRDRMGKTINHFFHLARLRGMLLRSFQR